MAGPTDLHSLAEEFLEACVEALDTVPTYAPALGGAPERSFVTYAPPVADCCPQLTVHTGTISEGATAPGTPTASHTWINRVPLVATVFRCVPVVDPPNLPTPAEQAEAAEQIHADRWALQNYLHYLIAEGLLFDKCGDVIWNGPAPLTPSGGCGGTLLTITVSYPGYTPALGT